jgi:hypothetical protein
MKHIKLFEGFLNEMWDSDLDIKISKVKVNGEDATYEFEADGSTYTVFIYLTRSDDSGDFSLELHFSVNKDGKYSNDLTGKNNMQRVMSGVWKCVIDWSKNVSKGGYLCMLMISGKSEEKGDTRRIRIYGDFLARKASQIGMKITGSEDITDLYKEISDAFGGSGDTITYKYYVDRFPIENLKSL